MRRDRLVTRGLVVLALASAPLSLAGCGTRLLGWVPGLHRHAPPQATPTNARAAKTEDTKSAAPKDAYAELREKAALDPTEPYWPYRLARTYLEHDSIGPALSALHASIARNPSYAPAMSLLAKLDYDAGRYSDAVVLLEPVRAHPETFDPESRRVLLVGLALHLDALGRPDLARQALRSLPDREIERAGSAAVYLGLRGEHPDSAAALAESAADRDGRSAANQNNLGIARLRAGDPKGARKAFMTAIDRDPRLPGPYYNLAILEKYYVFDDQAAHRWFDAYWSRSHDDPDSLFGALGGTPPKSVAERGARP